MSSRNVHYVLSTHWDREWYQTFQVYRQRLVDLMDRHIAAIEDGTLKGPFTTDGQAIMLEDYLEVRPQRRGQVERLLAQGKLVAGPWYVLPDQFLVAGESLVRNLRLGRAVVRAMGARPSAAGFACDLFGHASQLPQIFKNFGITGALVWRGINYHATRHFLWLGADGTALPTYRFPGGGYVDYAAHVRHATQPEAAFDPDTANQELLDYVAKEKEVTEVDPILIFDGADHLEMDPRHYAVLSGQLGREEDGFNYLHGSLDDYLTEMAAQAERIATRVQGELRESGTGEDPAEQQWVIAGVLSSRVWIKQQNSQCETLLTQWAEPFGALATLAAGREYPEGFLQVAWKWLIKNHPHDSICGCSIDQVHEDMKFRFSQARQIAQRQSELALKTLAASIEGDIEEGQVRLCVFNPLPTAQSGTFDVQVHVPEDWPTFNEYFGYEPQPAFRIYDAQGNEVPFQRLEQQSGRMQTFIKPTHFPQAYKATRVRLTLPLTLPALGCTTLSVRRDDSGRPTRHPARPSLTTSERSMANEFIDVTIESNGTLTLVDKQSGQRYERLLTFEDCMDIGDGWFHYPALANQVFVSSACAADVALVHEGPFKTTLRIRTVMRLPSHATADPRQRSGQFVEQVIESDVTLRPGARNVEVVTRVVNQACDHRLRVLFPSGASAAQTFWSDTPFDVIERSIALPGDGHRYRELPVETHPQRSWHAVSDGARGLAVISRGLLECAVRDQPQRPLALTLYRSTSRTYLTDGEPEGQLLGHAMEFRYDIRPVDGRSGSGGAGPGGSASGG